MADPKASDATSEQFVCPECGKSFSRAAALGSHRRRVHGVAGSSKAASGARASSRSRKTATAAASSSTPPSPTARSRSASSRAKTPSRRQRAAGRSRGSATTNEQLDRDQLLRTLFPNGVPPREDVLRAVNGWLDEAERLTRLK